MLGKFRKTILRKKKKEDNTGTGNGDDEFEEGMELEEDEEILEEEGDKRRPSSSVGSALKKEDSVPALPSPPKKGDHSSRASRAASVSSLPPTSSKASKSSKDKDKNKDKDKDKDKSKSKKSKSSKSRATQALEDSSNEEREGERKGRGSRRGSFSANFDKDAPIYSPSTPPKISSFPSLGSSGSLTTTTSSLTSTTTRPYSSSFSANPDASSPTSTSTSATAPTKPALARSVSFFSWMKGSDLAAEVSLESPSSASSASSSSSSSSSFASIRSNSSSSVRSPTTSSTPFSYSPTPKALPSPPTPSHPSTLPLTPTPTPTLPTTPVPTATTTTPAPVPISSTPEGATIKRRNSSRISFLTAAAAIEELTPVSSPSGSTTTPAPTPSLATATIPSVYHPPASSFISYSSSSSSSTSPSLPSAPAPSVSEPLPVLPPKPTNPSISYSALPIPPLPPKPSLASLSSASLPTAEVPKKKGKIIGELYVMVLKAEDLKTPTSDVLVFVNASQHRNTQRSLDVPTTAKPTLNEEFVLQVTNPAEPLVVELISVGAFLNTFLGSATIDLKTLTDGKLVEDWFPMRQAAWWKTQKEDSPVLGRMLLRVRYTADRPSPLLTLPLPPAEKAVTNSSIRLPSVRLVLERHTYFPGDTINGYILVNVQEKFLALNIQKPLLMKGIRVRFHGCTKTMWPKSEVTWYTAKLSFFDESITVFGHELSKNNEVVLEAGTYKWPFSYTLPHFIPPCHYYKEVETYAITHYWARLHFDAAKEEESLTIHQDLRMLEQYSPTAEQELLMGAGEKAQALLKTQDVALVVNVPAAVFAGEVLPVKLLVVNNADRAVTSFEYELWMEVIFHSDSHRRPQGQVGDKFVFHRKNSLDPWVEQVAKGTFTFEGLPIPAGQSWNGVATSIILPKTLEPSLPESISPLIIRTYKLKISLLTDGNIFTYGKMDTNFHVLVGFHKSVALSLPEQYPGNLQSLTAAQIHPEDAASMFFDFKDSSQLTPTVAPAVEA